jgi:hypothetical protein
MPKKKVTLHVKSPKEPGAGGSCLVILATQETESRRMAVRSQPGKTVSKKFIKKKKKAGGMAESVVLEFKPQNHTHTHTSPAE